MGIDGVGYAFGHFRPVVIPNGADDQMARVVVLVWVHVQSDARCVRRGTHNLGESAVDVRLEIGEQELGRYVQGFQVPLTLGAGLLGTLTVGHICEQYQEAIGCRLVGVNFVGSRDLPMVIGDAFGTPGFSGGKDVSVLFRNFRLLQAGERGFERLALKLLIVDAEDGVRGLVGTNKDEEIVLLAKVYVDAERA